MYSVSLKAWGNRTRVEQRRTENDLQWINWKLEVIKKWLKNPAKIWHRTWEMYLDIQCLHCLLRPHQERGPTVTVHSHLENTVGVCHGLRLHFIQWCCRSSPYKSAIGYNTIWKQWPQRDNALKTHMNRKAQSLIIDAVWDDVNREQNKLPEKNFDVWELFLIEKLSSARVEG